MLNISKLFILSPLALCLAGCTATPEAKVPGNSTAVNEAAHIFPDYRDIVVPPNVAPLNLQITDEAEAYVHKSREPDAKCWQQQLTMANCNSTRWSGKTCCKLPRDKSWT